MRIRVSLNKFRFSLRARFILVITVVLVIIFSLMAFLLLRNARANLTDDLNKNSVAFAELATRPIGDTFSVYQSYGSLRVKQEIKKFTSLNKTISNVGVISVDGQELFSSNTNSVVGVHTSAASAFAPTNIRGSFGAYSAIIQPYFDTNGLHQFAISYSISTDELEKTISEEFITIITLALLGLTIAAGVTYFLINRLFLRPLEVVSHASLAISDGQYTQQISTGRNDEIGDLAKSVNQMATNLKNDIFKLQEVDKMKNEFIMITSHNLRTPLTIMKGNVELLKESELPGSLRSFIDRIESGLQRLAAFSEDILMITSMEDEKMKITIKPVKISKLFEGIKETFQEVADEKGIIIDWQVSQPDDVIAVSATHIRGAVRNLIDNAIKFSSRGGHVHFNCEINGKDLILSVSDDGTGITLEEMRNLFVKFHRGTSTLNYDYEGTGIGLYAVKLIAKAHDGKVTARSTVGKGSTFVINLPNVLVTAE